MKLRHKTRAGTPTVPTEKGCVSCIQFLPAFPFLTATNTLKLLDLVDDLGKGRQIILTVFTKWTTILGLAGMELAFSTAACPVLCFRFVAETLLIGDQHFGYCWTVLGQHQGFAFSQCATPSKEARGKQEVGSGHSWDSWPESAKGLLRTI